MSRRIKGAHVITPVKKQVGRIAAYAVSIISLLILACEIPIFISGRYYLVLLPVITFAAMDVVSKKMFAWYRMEEFKIIRPNNEKPYLQFNYYDALSTNDSWVKVYKATGIERYDIKGSDCVVRCSEATVQSPPLKPKSIKKIKIYDVDDDVIEMIQNIQEANEKGETA